ncbi:MAG: M4 family metallopeptidase [Bacteroidia bacterium]|nr:M4 family metallopeptidase [Bacteroidia bacterium]
MKVLKYFSWIVLVSGYLFTYAQTDKNRNLHNTTFFEVDLVHYNTLHTPAYLRLRTGYNVAQQNALAWLKKTLQVSPNDDFVLIKTTQDELGYVHQKYQQYHNGFPVETGIYILHTKNGLLHSANGVFYDSLTNISYPSLNEHTALQKALEYTNAQIYMWQVPDLEQHLKIEQRNPQATYYPKGQLVYAPKDHQYKPKAFRLSYKFDIYAYQPLSRKYVYVDAQTGEIILTQDLIHTFDSTGVAHTRYSDIQTIKTSFVSTNLFHLKESARSGVETYNMLNGTNYAAAVDFEDTDNIWNNVNPQQDEVATDAHWGAEMSYDYFKNVHNRLSYNDANAPLYSYVHYSTNYLNAFWDGWRMTYGDGSGSFGPLTSIDIVVHEFTHGVTGNTADLIYYSESGALNESFSDIFAKCVEKMYRPGKFSWIIGKDIHAFGAGIRSMSNPNMHGNPDTYHGNYWYFGAEDNAGVHTNSGVQNYWFYLLCEGGSGINDIGNAFNVAPIGFHKAEKIAYRNLSVYLTPSSNYADARFYSLIATGDLYGFCGSEYASVANAWYAVGVGNAYKPGVEADFETYPQTFCYVPVTVQFKDKSNNAFSYHWNFGNSTTSTASNPVATYTYPGSYNVQLIVNGGCGTDTVVKTDYIQINTLASPTSNNVGICKGTSTVLHAVPSGSGQIYWYNSLTSTTPLFVGNTFTTPSLSATTTYYVAEEVKNSLQTLGPVDTSFTLVSNTVAPNYYLVFDVYKDIVLDSVTVYATQAGDRIIQVKDKSNNVVASKTVNLGIGKHQVYLGFAIKAGTDYKIGLDPSSVGRLLRNYNSIPYPYTIPGLASIKKSSVNNNYFFFYNWKIRERNCTSPRVPVQVNVFTKPSTPVISVSGGNLIANASPATHFQWFFNGNPISGATNQIYTPTVTGIYTVVAYNHDCASNTSGPYSYTSSFIFVQEGSELSLHVYPNPAQEYVYVQFSQLNSAKSAQIVDMQGKVVAEVLLEQLLNKIDISHLPKGVYSIKVEGYKLEKLIIY